MSLLRFSQIGDQLYATEPNGRLDLSSNVGRQLQIVRPGEQGAPPDELVDYVAVELDQLGPASPVVLMVHGFDYDPLADPDAPPGETDNPHRRLFDFTEEDPEAHSVSWPLRFGFADADDGAAGLAVAFGWDSHTKPYHLEAYHRGTAASWGLIAILAAIRQRQPARRVDVVAHSLGTHVVLNMLQILAINEYVRMLLPVLHRVVLLGGAEFVYHARRTYRALETIPDADGAPLLDHLQIYNFISRTDEVVKVVSETVTYGPLGTEKHMIGYHGLQRGPQPPNWIDIDLTSDALVQWSSDRFGLNLSGDAPNEWLDHWHFYVWRDNTAFIARILRSAGEMDIDILRAEGIPDGVAQLDPENTSWRYEDTGRGREADPKRG